MKKSLILISNSFGVNLQTYLHQVSLGTDIEYDVGTLYIGGCSLQRHCQNVESQEKAYEWFFNGQSTGRYISIQDALKMQRWDYISLQQVSHLAGIIESYFPYIKDLYDYVHVYQPQAEIIFHKTWPYADNTVHPNFKDYQNNREVMRICIDLAVSGVTKYLGINTIIDSGSIINKAYPKYLNELYDSEGFHLSNKGCYLIALEAIKCLNPNYQINDVYVPDGFNKDECLKFLEYLK